jgi:hypothetical protein
MTLPRIRRTAPGCVELVDIGRALEIEIAVFVSSISVKSGGWVFDSRPRLIGTIRINNSADL